MCGDVCVLCVCVMYIIYSHTTYHAHIQPTTTTTPHNPTQSRQEVRGSSLMQPLPRPNQHAAAPGWVGSEAFAALAEDEVSPDALFFHKYYG